MNTLSILILAIGGFWGTFGYLRTSFANQENTNDKKIMWNGIISLLILMVTMISAFGLEFMQRTYTILQN